MRNKKSWESEITRQEDFVSEEATPKQWEYTAVFFQAQIKAIGKGIEFDIKKNSQKSDRAIFSDSEEKTRFFGRISRHFGIEGEKANKLAEQGALTYDLNFIGKDSPGSSLRTSTMIDQRHTWKKKL